MYCAKCGRAVGQDEKFCKNCGTKVGTSAAQSYNSFETGLDRPSAGLKVVSFLFPLIGLILWAAYSNSRPLSAKAYSKWALIGFVVGVVVATAAFYGLSWIVISRCHFYF